MFAGLIGRSQKGCRKRETIRYNPWKGRRMKSITEFRPLEDVELPARFSEVIGKWRSLAAKFFYDGPVVWLVPAGFSILDSEHWPLLPRELRKRAEAIAGWKFLDREGETTRRQLVFGLPIPLDGSERKNVQQQQAFLADLRKQYQLPESHLSAFGKTSTLVGLILAYNAISGEAGVWDGKLVRTDTLLNSAWDELDPARPHGQYWALSVCDRYIASSFPEERSTHLCCCALGEEQLQPGELE